MAGALTQVDKRLTDWATSRNPFFDGANSDWLALIPFVLLAGFLYLVGREMVLANKSDLGPSGGNSRTG